MSEFVNPYTFAPLGPAPHRSAYPGHLSRGAGDLRFSGTIDIEWEMASPMLLPEGAEREGWVQPDRTIRVPGSSLKGTIRSVHEAMFNGCLRIVDEGFVPGYRAPATKDDGWTLALVRGSDNGRPTQFQMCDAAELVWVDAVQLQRKCQGSLPTTGDLVHVYGAVEDTTLDRYEIRSVDDVEMIHRAGRVDVDGRPVGLPPVGECDKREVFIVTDVGTRKLRKRDGSPGRCLWASAPLTGTVVVADSADEQAVIDGFVHAAEGTDDRRRLLGQERRGAVNGDPPAPGWRTGSEFQPVQWQGRTVGRRALQTGLLWPGDVVWVRVEDGRLTGLKLSEIWREPGRGSVRDRIGDHYPCLTRAPADGLCPSCATFGAADTSGSDRGRGRQIAYAGHVRFGSAKSADAVELQTVSLTPMAAPRPGNGMFYLKLDEPRPDRRRDDMPTHWGGSSDLNRQSEIRGRKFYWHSDPATQARRWAGRPRYEATRAQQREEGGQKARTAQLVPAGTVLQSTVAVDGLPLPHLLALLLALDPRRAAAAVGASGRHAVRLAGGKPLGLGSATVTVTPHVTTASDRYARPVDGAGEIDVSASAARSLIDDSWGMDLARTMPPLLRVLDLDGLGDATGLVAYPPSADWSDFDRQEFRLSYEFFGVANGQQLRDHARAWAPLPTLDADGPMTMPIRNKKWSR